MDIVELKRIIKHLNKTKSEIETTLSILGKELFKLQEDEAEFRREVME
jgi:hypothetical protein